MIDHMLTLYHLKSSLNECAREVAVDWMDSSARLRYHCCPRSRIDKTPRLLSVLLSTLGSLQYLTKTMKLLLPILFVAAVNAKCHEPTVAHPLPEYVTNDALLQHAFADISAGVMSVMSSPKFSATSFSIEVTSSKETLWSKHHTASERNASRSDIPEVNSDALYRIASITKTFTVLGLLYQEKAGNLSLDDPIDKYIKELKEPQNGTLPWKDITLRSLASQLSGIPRECVIPRKPWSQGFSGCHKLEGMDIDFR
jgi:CubicO group peptidase (beta-lactamase class C family)